jgi:hypothetical protein
MTIEGKVFDIIKNHPKVIEIVVRKKKGDRFYPICFVGFSKTIENVEKLGVEKTDKIKMGFTLSSKKYTDRNGNERYSTSAIIDWIDLIEKNASKQTEVIFVNENTGEIIQDADNLNNSSDI